jgi:hypothetical protein
MTRWVCALFVVACVPEPEFIDCSPASATTILEERGAY